MRLGAIKDVSGGEDGAQRNAELIAAHVDLEALELASTRMSPSGVRILRILNRSAINESPLPFIELEVAVASNLDDGVKQAIILLKPAIQRPAAWGRGKSKIPAG